jgi:hypothetical protein
MKRFGHGDQKLEIVGDSFKLVESFERWPLFDTIVHLLFQNGRFIEKCGYRGCACHTLLDDVVFLLFYGRQSLAVLESCEQLSQEKNDRITSLMGVTLIVSK